MAKIDKLLNKTVRDGEAKTLVVVVGIIVGVLIAVGLFFGLICISDMDMYLHDNKNIINLYDFYGLDHSNTTNIYFIGSSQIGQAIYAPLIQDILNENGYNLSVYNLFVNSDTPNQRLVEIEYIINTNPSLIIYGVSYRDFFDFSAYGDFYSDERFKLVYDRLDICDDAKNILSKQILKDVTTYPSLFYNKKFLSNATKYSLSPNKKEISYLSDAYGRNISVFSQNNSWGHDKIVEQVTKGGYWTSNVEIQSDNKNAFYYIISRVTESKIPILILNMPIHQLRSEAISNYSRDNYFQILNDCGVNYIDFEHYFIDDDHFVDSYHVSHVATLEFAPVMADLIIEQVENDVIHYT